MKIHAYFLPLLGLIACSCDERKEVVITETREITTRDVEPKLFANSDQRFRDAKPSPIKGEAPGNWLPQPSTQFRLLNYQLGASGETEVWVSLSAGGVLENVNRWLNQFSLKPMTDEQLADQETVKILGKEGVWVVAEGDYVGMGAGVKPGYGLAGTVADVNGRILTVKMVGPKEEVEAAHADLRIFIESLSLQGEL